MLSITGSSSGVLPSTRAWEINDELEGLSAVEDDGLVLSSLQRNKGWIGVLLST